MSVWRGCWWVIAFCAATGTLHFHFLKEKKNGVRMLAQRLEQMQNEKGLAFQKREDLQLRIASQNDPAWIEMILMRDLGVVPEGFLKVHFKR